MIKLGQEIIIDEIIEKNNNWESRHLEKPLSGVVVGMRTVFAGDTSWGGEDAGRVFYPKQIIKAMLVATSLWRKPYYVEISRKMTKSEEMMAIHRRDRQSILPPSPRIPFDI